MSRSETRSLSKEIAKTNNYKGSLFYDEIAEDYEEEIIYGSLFYYEHYKAIADFILRYVLSNGLRKEVKILDIGCGTGFWTKIFRDLGFDVVGLDLSSKSIEKAFSRGLEVFVNDASHMSLRKESFDVAIALSSVVNHLDDLSGFLRDVWLVLKKNGYLIFDFDSAWSIDNFYEALLFKNSPREILTKFISFGFLTKGYRIYWDFGDIYIRVYSPLEVINSLRRYGFRVLRFEPIHIISSIIPVRVQEKTKNPLMKRIIDTIHKIDNGLRKNIPFYIAPFSVSYIVLAKKQNEYSYSS